MELSGALAELFTKVLAKDFETLDVRSAEVDPRRGRPARSSARSPVRRSAEAVRELEARGVRDPARHRIASVDAATASCCADGTRIDSQAVIWCAGVKANPLADVLGLPQTRPRRGRR